MDNEQIWQAVLGELEITLSKANFTTWFKNTFIIEINDGEFTIGVPNGFTREWLQGKYNKEIAHALQNITNSRVKKISYKLTSKKVSIKFQSSFSASTPEVAISPLTPQFSTNTFQDNTESNYINGSNRFNPKYTFDNFIIGKNNELAKAASLAVAKNPGTNYNPLFIYGGVGLGKTHLMQAIGNEILKNNKKYKIVYVTCEKFTDDFVNYLQKEKGRASSRSSSFKNKYRTVDFFLVDDIQFLGGKEGIQEEFFHTFNTIYQANKQIVLTSDRPPKLIPKLEDRLTSRFEGGMVADIGMPDFETRKAILITKCKEKAVTIEEEVINYIAHNIQNNIRELEGALSKVIAYSQLRNMDINESTVKSILTNLSTQTNKRTLTNDKIINVVSCFYNVKKEDLLDKSRRKEVSWPRQIAMYLMRNEGKVSYPTIGNELGGRDHTTAIHACEKVSKELEKDDTLRQEIEAIRQQLLQSSV